MTEGDVSVHKLASTQGILPNGNFMAVKLLFPQKTSKGLDEFLNEVVLLTGMKYRNLVNRKGCCIREQQRLLVYEIITLFTLCCHDFVGEGGANKADLSWPVRWKIVLGVARGLHYLHALAHPRIIHRDIKASNILLTKNYDTRIADFGLALLFPDEQSCIVTKHVAGTKGYLAPEYASCGRLSDKVDVYSFGVLCLEIVSGRRNIDDSYPPGEMYRSKLVWDLYRQGKLVDSVDRTMSLRDEEKVEVHRVMNIALLCIQNEAEERPSMERVVAMLQGESEAEVVALKPGNEGNLLESTRLFAGCSSGLGTVKEEGESSFMESSSGGGSRYEKDNSTGAVLELSEIRVR
nr:putative serine/threonine-protein kinase [Physcomitrium patens]|eukprot:XP_024365978.1 putative serine/threonine-protein kinase [Physcomitrella patens]